MQQVPLWVDLKYFTVTMSNARCVDLLHTHACMGHAYLEWASTADYRYRQRLTPRQTKRPSLSLLPHSFTILFCCLTTTETTSRVLQADHHVFRSKRLVSPIQRTRCPDICSALLMLDTQIQSIRLSIMMTNNGDGYVYFKALARHGGFTLSGQAS